MNETSDVLLRYYVYTIFSHKDKRFYTGYTTNLKQRLHDHAKGSSKATKFRRPFLLIHYGYFINENDAKYRERFLKKWIWKKTTKRSVEENIEKYLKSSSGFAFRNKHLIQYSLLNLYLGGL